MKISTSTQKPIRQKSKTKQIENKEIMQTNNHGNFQCLFFQFSCGPKSDENKKTLHNEKQKGEQTEFQLASSKKLAPSMISLVKAQNQKEFLETTNNSGQKSFGNVFLNQSKISQLKNQQNINNVSLTDQSFNQPNPSSIDREKHDLRIRIGAEKILTKTRFSYMPPLSNSLKQNNLNQTTYSSNSSSSKPRVYFQNNCIQSKRVSSSTYNFNYLNDSRTQIHFVSNKHPSSPQNKIQFCIKPYHLSNGEKSYHLTQASTAKHDNQNCAYDVTTFQLTNKTTEIFQQIQIEKPKKTQQINLQGSIFFNYSSKYKDYMLKQLVHSARNLPQQQQNNIMNLIESARIQCDSIDQEQNQKQHSIKSLKRLDVTQQKKKQSGLCAKQNKFEDKKVQTPISISSSFAVIEDKQKETQNTKNIYLHSLMDSSVIPDKQIGGLTQQNTFTSQYSEQGIHVTNFMDENSLITQIRCLNQDIEFLAEQQKDLKLKLDLIVSSNSEELEKSMQQLQSLKLLSEDRQRDLNILSQLLKVKKISKVFNKNPTLKQKYLQDEKGWELYIEQQGDFEQIDLSDDTSETNNVATKACFEKEINSLNSELNS